MEDVASRCPAGPRFRGLQERVMRQDWSWNRPALDYVELYHSAIGH